MHSDTMKTFNKKKVLHKIMTFYQKHEKTEV